MRILFFTENTWHGSCIMRAVWPALWINTFTEHTAHVFSHAEAMGTAHDGMMMQADVMVFHKAHPQNFYAARKARDMGKIIVYDSDDHDEDTFNEHYAMFYAAGMQDNLDWFRENAHGFTVGSGPLSTLYENACVLPNGFDVNRAQWRPNCQPYYTNSGGVYRKIAWGGGSTHARDFEMFLKLGALEELMSRHRLDVYIYGLLSSPSTVQSGKGKIVFAPKDRSGIEYYIRNLYSDACFLFAPLIQDNFNGYRSTLKLVEAGVAGKTIVASRVASYEEYAERGTVRVVNNTKGEWVEAMETLLLDDDLRHDMAKRNHEYVSSEFTAEEITKKRINYFKEIHDLHFRK